MALSAKKARYTFADVLPWEESERIEMVNALDGCFIEPGKVFAE